MEQLGVRARSGQGAATLHAPAPTVARGPRPQQRARQRPRGVVTNTIGLVTMIPIFVTTYGMSSAVAGWLSVR